MTHDELRGLDVAKLDGRVRFSLVVNRETGIWDGSHVYLRVHPDMVALGDWFELSASSAPEAQISGAWVVCRKDAGGAWLRRLGEEHGPAT